MSRSIKKNYNAMKTKLLLIVLLIGGCWVAAAQSRIWELVTGLATAPVMQVYGRPLCPMEQTSSDVHIPFTVDEIPVTDRCRFKQGEGGVQQ